MIYETKLFYIKANSVTHAFWNKSGFGKFLESFWKKNLSDMNVGEIKKFK
jgi:hypothetical protein